MQSVDDNTRGMYEILDFERVYFVKTSRLLRQFMRRCHSPTDCISGPCFDLRLICSGLGLFH